MQKHLDTEGQLYVRIKWSVACSVLSTAPGIRHLLVTCSICHCSPQSRETWQPPSAPWVVVLGQCTERPRIHLSRIFQSYCVLASIFILSPSIAAGRLRAIVRTTLSSRCANLPLSWWLSKSTWKFRIRFIYLTLFSFFTSYNSLWFFSF